MRTDRLTDIKKLKAFFATMQINLITLLLVLLGKAQLRIEYKNHLTYVLQGYNCCFAETHTKHINALLERTQNFLTLKLLVSTVTTCLCFVNI